MINRILIRVKVLQNLYSYMLNKSYTTLPEAQEELTRSFEQSYNLYYYILRLIVELTDLQDRRLDDAMHKFNATEQDLNPDTRFVDNSLADALRASEEFIAECRQRHIAWDDIVFMIAMLDQVTSSEPYNEYMALPSTSLADDCHVWRQLLRDVIATSSTFTDKLEAMSVYWSSEDADVMMDFAVKTIDNIERGLPHPFTPMFKTDGDREYAETLFAQTIKQMHDNNQLINELMLSSRWEPDRVALTDRLIMCAAITELKEFDSIPTSVTLNEYIELAKVFSTKNSGQFVNGVLNAALERLRSDKVVVKP